MTLRLICFPTAQVPLRSALIPWVAHDTSTHVDLADHYARELFEAGIITISFVPTDEMIADTFTKALPEAKFKKFAKAIMGH